MPKKSLRLTLWLCVLCSLFGCHPTQNPVDPYEGFNRKVFAINAAIDHTAIKPAAELYSIVVPPPLQSAVRNVFSNVNNVSYIINDVLQLRLMYALADTWRLIINSTLGVGGIFDVAKYADLPQHTGQSFGTTLGVWGWQQSAYLVLPLVGPSTVRDSFSIPMDDWLLDFPRYITPVSDRNNLVGTRFVSTRADLLHLSKIVDQAFDPYVFVRNAYLQQRQNIISNDHYYAIAHEMRQP